MGAARWIIRVSVPVDPDEAPLCSSCAVATCRVCVEGVDVWLSGTRSEGHEHEHLCGDCAPPGGYVAPEAAGGGGSLERLRGWGGADRSQRDRGGTATRDRRRPPEIEPGEVE